MRAALSSLARLSLDFLFDVRKAPATVRYFLFGDPDPAVVLSVFLRDCLSYDLDLDESDVESVLTEALEGYPGG